MCVIIIKQKDNMMSEDIAKTSSKINPDGLGIVWLDTFKVTYHNSDEYKILLTNRPFIAHFRYATKGAVNLENTHPFVCGKNKDELLMHNGTIQGLGNNNVCDSKQLAIQLGSIKRKAWRSKLETYESRFVSINLRTRSFQIYNRNLYTYRDGIWYSKANVLQDNLVAVYGTLKKGYSNYYSYLDKATHIGTGFTKDKYPLIVNGLPYLINKKGVGHNVDVDVFKVSDVQMDKLDALEGHPQWYRRVQIPIVVNDKTISCWVYFNPKEISSNTQLHKSFEQPHSYDNYRSYLDEPSFDASESHQAIDIGWSDDSFPTEDTPMCGECFSDVEHDLFQNYYCSSCGNWFRENEVLNSRQLHV
tara:strand:- start:1117 stop:2196 length:1080 start_codon:yes stop_codon:yes gene_type:complete